MYTFIKIGVDNTTTTAYF